MKGTHIRFELILLIDDIGRPVDLFLGSGRQWRLELRADDTDLLMLCAGRIGRRRASRRRRRASRRWLFVVEIEFNWRTFAADVIQRSFSDGPDALMILAGCVLGCNCWWSSKRSSNRRAGHGNRIAKSHWNSHRKTNWKRSSSSSRSWNWNWNWNRNRSATVGGTTSGQGTGTGFGTEHRGFGSHRLRFGARRDQIDDPGRLLDVPAVLQVLALDVELIRRLFRHQRRRRRRRQRDAVDPRSGALRTPLSVASAWNVLEDPLHLPHGIRCGQFSSFDVVAAVGRPLRCSPSRWWRHCSHLRHHSRWRRSWGRSFDLIDDDDGLAAQRDVRSGLGTAVGSRWWRHQIAGRDAAQRSVAALVLLLLLLLLLLTQTQRGGTLHFESQTPADGCRRCRRRLGTGR